MKKEKHIVNNVYGNHQLARYIDVYEVSANGCHSVPESGYKGTEATLVDEPAWNEKFSSYSITGATLTGNNFILNNDVTAQANYETAKNVTLQTDGHGTITASPISGFSGTIVTLSNTPAQDYNFLNYDITGATLTGSQFKIANSNVNVKANFHNALNPLDLPPYTIRVKYTNGSNPSSAVYKGTWTRVSTSPNIWDVKCETNDWSYLFAGAQTAGLIDVMGANTTNVTSMYKMFSFCRTLTSVELFDTSTVTYASRMFDCTYELLEVPCYNLSNVRSAEGMFSNARKLKYIPDFDLHNIVDAHAMFFDTFNVESGALNMYSKLSARGNEIDHGYMFFDCGKNSEQGSAEVAQIPIDWVGVL